MPHPTLNVPPAKLAEVAGEMLAALQAVQNADRLNVPEWNAAMRLVDAAIAKATNTNIKGI